MNVTWTFNLRDRATLPLKNFVASLRSRRDLHRSMGARVRELCRNHLIAISNTRKNALGAPSSRFWGKAAEKVAPPLADNERALITIHHPGIRRAFEDVKIEPTGGKQWLTIPLIAAAYNRRAYRVKGLFRPGKKSDPKRVLSQRNKDGSLTHWYALVKSVLQKQDRSLLPSDEAFGNAAMQGALDYVNLRTVRLNQTGGAA